MGTGGHTEEKSFQQCKSVDAAAQIPWQITTKCVKTKKSTKRTEIRSCGLDDFCLALRHWRVHNSFERAILNALLRNELDHRKVFFFMNGGTGMPTVSTSSRSWMRSWRTDLRHFKIVVRDVWHEQTSIRTSNIVLGCVLEMSSPSPRLHPPSEEQASLHVAPQSGKRFVPVGSP